MRRRSNLVDDLDRVDNWTGTRLALGTLEYLGSLATVGTGSLFQQIEASDEQTETGEVRTLPWRQITFQRGDVISG